MDMFLLEINKKYDFDHHLRTILQGKNFVDLQNVQVEPLY